MSMHLVTNSVSLNSVVQPYVQAQAGTVSASLQQIVCLSFPFYFFFSFLFLKRRCLSSKNADHTH